MLGPLLEGCNDVAKGAEALVDVLSLLEALPCRAGLAQPLAACQVDQVQFAHKGGPSGPVARGGVYRKDEVRPRRVLIHVGRKRRSIGLQNTPQRKITQHKVAWHQIDECLFVSYYSLNDANDCMGATSSRQTSLLQFPVN
eukprot:scaffold9785_cov43-Prasinocladus_malaysianus.AAC.2